MRMINHALTGGVIGLAVGKPLVALPLALVSHFVCDVIPHYDSRLPDNLKLKSNSFRNLLYADISLSGVFVLVLVVIHPLNWLLAAVCAFIAALPDAVYINIYRQGKRGDPITQNRFVKLTRGIQWFQRPIGVVVEVIWFTGAVILLLPFLR